MNNIEIIAQVIVLIAYLICGVAFLQKKQYKILIFVSIFNLLMLIQYYLLNATMGIIANAINIFRIIIFIYNSKHNKQNSIYLLIPLCLITISLTICFYSSYLDIFPCLIALIGTFSYWINNTKVLRVCNILCSICYIIYAIPIHSYITIIAEVYFILINGCKWLNFMSLHFYYKFYIYGFMASKLAKLFSLFYFSST